MAPADGHGDPGVAYNVYNQPLDSSNQMPVTPNQLPFPGQVKPLSTERAVSNIPKGGTAGANWVFPSSQMFYNALMRKGKGGDVVEDDMDAIISVHNGAAPCGRCFFNHAAPYKPLPRARPRALPGMNELTWQQVLRWEHLHRDEGTPPSLLRFLGRPDDLSPRARWRTLLQGAHSAPLPRPCERSTWLTYAAAQARPLSTATTGTSTVAGGKCATSSTSISTRAAPAPRTPSPWTRDQRWTTCALCWTAQRWGCARARHAAFYAKA